MTQFLNLINLPNNLWFKKRRRKIRCSLKMEGASSRLREDTVPGNSGGRALFSNYSTVGGTLLQTILDNWAFDNFSFFFWIQLEVVLMHTDNISSTLQYIRHVKKVSELQKYVFQHYKAWERKLVFIMIFFKKITPSSLEKETFRVIMRQKKLL